MHTNRSNLQRRVFCVALFWAWVGNTACAQELRVLSENLPPLHFQQDGQWHGPNYDKVRSALNQSGFAHVNVELAPWPRAKHLTRTRKNTLLFSLVRTPQREANFVWVALLNRYDFGFVGKATKHRALDSIDDARDGVTAVINGDLAHGFLLAQGFVEGENLAVLASVESTFEFLQLGRADYIITSNEFIAYMANALRFDASELTMYYPIPELSLGFYLAAHPDTDADIVLALQSALAELPCPPDTIERVC